MVEAQSKRDPSPQLCCGKGLFIGPALLYEHPHSLIGKMAP